MVDYTKPTGAGGTMMIRDHGWLVEFWIKAGSTNTWFASAPFSWTIDGSGSGTFSYSTGAAWKLVFSRNATYSQNVTFYIGNTGTSGIGGPTSFTQWINRATVPPAQRAPDVYNITNTSVTARMYDNGDGGATITSRQIGYGKDPNTPIHQMTVDGTGIGAITGITPGRIYYFWSRSYNSMGWGPWGSRSQITTHNVPSDPLITSIVINPNLSVTIAFNDGANNGSAITARQIGYGTNINSPTTNTGNITSPVTISDLVPGNTYYFWARCANVYGYGPYGNRVSTELLGTVRVRIAGVWKNAIPYVKVSGVWKNAIPYVKVSGVWKNTS